MKCMYYQQDKGPCWPEECEGEAWFLIGIINDGGVIEGSGRPLCHTHIETYALEFLERMHMSIAVENDLLDIGLSLEPEVSAEQG